MILTFLLMLLGVLIGMRITRKTRVEPEMKRADFYQDVADGYAGEQLLLVAASKRLLDAQMEYFANLEDADTFVDLAIARDQLESLLESIDG